MTVAVNKLSISLASEDVAWARKRAEALGVALSTYLARLLAEERRRVEALSLVDWFESVHGPIPSEVQVEADEETRALFGESARDSEADVAGLPEQRSDPASSSGS